jgi:hypothetical protein
VNVIKNAITSSVMAFSFGLLGKGFVGHLQRYPSKEYSPQILLHLGVEDRLRCRTALDAAMAMVVGAKGYTLTSCMFFAIFLCLYYEEFSVFWG